MGVPRYTVLNTVFPDYARVADVARAIELELRATTPPGRRRSSPRRCRSWAPPRSTASGITTASPSRSSSLIRIEDERREAGDYVASLLEDIGFVVDRQYKTAGEASPIWISSEPDQGLFHIYTGGWVSTAINRDLGSNFDYLL